MCGVYPVKDALVAGDEISSTYEGRHVTLREDELVHLTAGFVAKGDPVISCLAGVGATHGQLVGVAFTTGLTVDDLIAIDTEGIWNLEVVADDDAGVGSAVVPGDRLYIHHTTCVISKITNIATQIPFGLALGNLDASAEGTIAVKVHQDPNELEEVFGAKTFDGAVTMDSTLNVAGIADFASGVLIYGSLNVVENVTFTYACTFLNLGWSSLAGCTFTPDPADGFTRVFMGGLPLGAGGLASGRLWENAGVINIIP